MLIEGGKNKMGKAILGKMFKKKRNALSFKNRINQGRIKRFNGCKKAKLRKSGKKYEVEFECPSLR